MIWDCYIASIFIWKSLYAKINYMENRPRNGSNLNIEHIGLVQVENDILTAFRIFWIRMSYSMCGSHVDEVPNSMKNSIVVVQVQKPKPRLWSTLMDTHINLRKGQSAHNSNTVVVPLSPWMDRLNCRLCPDNFLYYYQVHAPTFRMCLGWNVELDWIE